MMMVAFLHHALLEIKTMPVVFSELCLSPCLPHLWCKCNYNSTRLISQCVFIFQKCCFRVYLNSISTIIRRENNNNKSIPILHDTCQLVGHKNGKRQKHVGCTVLKKRKFFRNIFIQQQFFQHSVPLRISFRQKQSVELSPCTSHT